MVQADGDRGLLAALSCGMHALLSMLRLLLPTLLAIVLFVVAIFAILIPSTGWRVERKRDAFAS